MRTPLLPTLVIMCVSVTSLQSQGRIFKDVNGREVSGEIRSVRGNLVDLEIGGKLHPVSIATLSPEDQGFVREWAKQNRTVALDYRANLVEDPTTRRTTRGDDDKSDTRTWKYGAAIQNRSGSDLVNLVVKYNIVLRHTKTSKERSISGRTKDESARIVFGTTVIPFLENSKHASFETIRQQTMTREWKVKKSSQVRDNEGRTTTVNYWDEYTDETQLDGIWLKVFLEGHMVSEWKSAGKLIKEIEWSDTSKDETPPVGGVPGAPPAFVGVQTSNIHPDLPPVPPIPEAKRRDAAVTQLWFQVLRTGGIYKSDAERGVKPSELRKIKAEFQDLLVKYEAAIAQ